MNPYLNIYRTILDEETFLLLLIIEKIGNSKRCICASRFIRFYLVSSIWHSESSIRQVLLFFLKVEPDFLRRSSKRI